MGMEGRALMERFASVGIDHSGVFLLRPYDALRLIEQAEEAGVPVYGLDAFLLHPDNKIQPDMEFDVNGSYEPSKTRLREHMDGKYWFEVSLDDG